MATQRQPPHVYSATAFRRPQVAVEIVVFVVSDGRLGIVLVPFEGFSTTPRWSLPTAAIEDQPSLETTLDDLIEPLLGAGSKTKRQVQTFDRLSDSSGRLIEIAWFAVTPVDALQHATTPHTVGYLTASSGDTLELVDGAGGEILAMPDEQSETVLAAIDRLRGLLDSEGIALEFLPEEFTLRELYTVYEAVLATSLNYDSFRRRMLTSGSIEPSGRAEQNVQHRPAELYRVRG